MKTFLLILSLLLISKLSMAQSGWFTAYNFSNPWNALHSCFFDEQLTPGTYEADWPAPLGDGLNHSSGVYNYELTVRSEQLAVF